MTALDKKAGTLTANGVFTVSFVSRYQFVEIRNEDASAFISGTTNNVAPTIDGDDCFVIGPGERRLVANGMPMWWQGFGGPAGKANPGTVVQLISAGTPLVIVEGTG